MSTNTTTLTTAIGWAVVVGATGAYWAYHVSKSKPKSKTQTATKQPNKGIEDRKEPKSKKPKKDGGLSSGDQDAKSSDKAQKKKKTQPLPKIEKKQDAVKTVAADDSDNEDAESNRKFAVQFAQTQAGTKLSGKPISSNRQKSVKQSRAQEKGIKDSGNMTAGSATGGDADDDQSFTDSPEVGPTSIASPVTNGISDMLEAPSPGPSVLKVTEPTNPKPAKKEKSNAAPAPVETKKQRQNRAKVEAAKLAREQEEKERKIKEEKQRRTAREAEGRAPKDGRQFMASQKPATSAWTAPPANGANNSTSTKANTGKFDLLDTMEDTSINEPTTSAPAEKFSESELAGSQWEGYGDYDERVKSVIEDSREWEQVSNKKRKAKKEKTENDGEGAGTTSSTDEKEYIIPPKTARSGPGQKWTADLTYVDEDDNVHEVQKELQDSEWEVS
jgi:hypothetical protein